jgi:hypothetical protein
MHNSGLDVEVHEPYGEGDSGWCDMATGYQIITNNHKFYIHTFTDKHETWLLLKYDNRVQLRYCSLRDSELEKVNF